MPRIFAPHDGHSFNAGGVQFVNGAAALAKDHASLPFFASEKGYDVDNSKHALTALDTLPRATLDAIAAYMGITLVPADGKLEVIRDIEGMISTAKLGTLTVASVAHASKVGFTVITVTEALTGTNVHKYKVHATEAPAPLYGDEADASWLPLTSGATGGIELTTGHKITVVECTTAGFIVGSGNDTVASKGA